MEIRINASDLIYDLKDLTCMKCDKEEWQCMSCEIQEDIKEILKMHIEKTICVMV